MVNKDFILGYGAGKLAADRPITPKFLIVTENGVYTPGIGSAFSRVTVNTPGGKRSILPNDVTFYDYNGSVVYSYTAEEFTTLSEMPANPTHKGLTAQGWNWALAEAKTYVATNKKLNIGQTYITSDGKTRVYISLYEGQLSPYLGLAVNGSVDVDWGDGSPHGTLTGTSISTIVYIQHNYEAVGDYVISIDPIEDSTFTILGDSETSRLLVVEAEDGASYVNATYLNTITKIEIGRGIVTLGWRAVSACNSLTAITIPNTVLSTDERAFASTTRLGFVVIPRGMTKIADYLFNGSYVYCVALPDSVSSIGKTAFSSAKLLRSITLPSKLTRINGSTFSTCIGLASITIPQKVSYIEHDAMGSLYGLTSIHFKRTTPPTMATTDSFLGYRSGLVIYVPYSADHSILEAYKAAAKYPDPEKYTYVEE